MAPKAPFGRLRTVYKPEYASRVEDFMAQGYSLTAFAGEIGASRADIDKWCKERRYFAAAVRRAQARRARLLEDRLLAAQGAGAFGAHMEALKTAAPDEWTPPPPAMPAKAARRNGPPAAELALPDNGRGD